MNFKQKNKDFLIRKDKGTNIFFPIAAVIIFVLVFSIPWTRKALFSAGSPLWYVKNGINSFLNINADMFKSKLTLIKENQYLKEQIQSKEKEYAMYFLIKKENEDIKNILNRREIDNLLLSAILVKPFLSPFDTLIIDVGEDKGVVVGDKVLADGNVYIGYISEVYNSTSKVVLYSTPGQKVPVLIGENNIEKEAIGLGGGNFKVEIPREIDVKEGDSVVFPSISTNIFGVVERVDFKETSAFQSVLFKNPINISELKWVQVVLSNKR